MWSTAQGERFGAHGAHGGRLGWFICEVNAAKLGVFGCWYCEFLRSFPVGPSPRETRPLHPGLDEGLRFLYVIFSQTVDRCLIKVLQLVYGILPLNSRTKMALLACASAFRLRRLAQSTGRGLGLRRFTSKFLHKMALLACASAFRLRRLAQSIGRDRGLRFFFLRIQAQNSFYDTSKRSSIAHARAKSGPWSWPAVFYLFIFA